MTNNTEIKRQMIAFHSWNFSYSYQVHACYVYNSRGQHLDVQVAASQGSYSWRIVRAGYAQWRSAGTYKSAREAKAAALLAASEAFAAMQEADEHAAQEALAI